MKRKIVLMLAVIYMLVSVVLPAAAVEVESNNEKIYFDDGSYLVVNIQVGNARATNTKSGSKVYTYYTNDDELVWKVTLRGTFTYNGTTSSCTASNVSINIINDSWYTVSQSADKDANEAYAVVTMGRKLLGITINKLKVELILACDKNGVLS